MDLDADKQAFVDAVMLPLGDDVPRREILQECLAVAETFPRLSKGDPVDRATQQMRATAASFKRRTQLSLITAVLIAIAATWTAVLGLGALKSVQEIAMASRRSDVLSSMCCTHEGVPGFPEITVGWKKPDDLTEYLAPLSMERRMLLVGSKTESDPAASWKAVWDLYPDNPAHYYAYATRHWRVHNVWPEDFVATGEKLDPTNGWFRFLAGAAKAKSSIGVRPPPPPPKLTAAERRAADAAERAARKSSTVVPATPAREVLDQASFDESFSRLEQALAMPRWDTYLQTLNRVRFEAAPPATDFGSHAAGHIASVMQPEDFLDALTNLRDYGEAFSFAIAAAVKDGNSPRLEDLEQTIQRLSARLAETDNRFISALVSRGFLMKACRDLAKAWNDLGDAGKAKRFEVVADSLDRKLHPPPAMPPDALEEHRGNGFLLKAYHGVREPYSSPVTEPEIRGGRLAEYAMYERFIVHAGAAFLFLVAIFLAIAYGKDRKELGLLPDRLAGLLKTQDRALILAAGVALPVGMYLLSTRLPWLETRAIGLTASQFFLWLLQIFALGISVVLVSLHVTRKCLAKRAPMLAMESGGIDPGLWMSVTALVMILVASLPALLNFSRDWLTMLVWICVGFLAGMPLLWLLNLAAYQFAGNPGRRLHRAILIRALIWPVTSVMLIAAIAIPLLRAEERYWIARLDYDALSPDYSIFEPRSEWEHAEAINAQIRRALESLQ